MCFSCDAEQTPSISHGVRSCCLRERNALSLHSHGPENQHSGLFGDSIEELFILPSDFKKI